VCCIYVGRVIRSFGLCLLSLLGSSASFSNVVARSFGCPVILSLYFWVMFVVSSRTLGMPRSACSILFGTYHGALTIVRSTLF
jgi:hypothetical protein